MAALSAQQVLAQENEATTLAALHGSGAVPQRPNHASCWVRQCLLQWSANCNEARYRKQLEAALNQKMVTSSKGSSDHIQQFGAGQIYSIFQQFTRDATLQTFVQWRFIRQTLSGPYRNVPLGPAP